MMALPDSKGLESNDSGVRCVTTTAPRPGCGGEITTHSGTKRYALMAGTLRSK